MSKFDKQLVEKEFAKKLEILYKKISNSSGPTPLTQEEIEYGMELVRKYYVYAASKGVKYGNIALDVIEKRTAFGEFANKHLRHSAKQEGFSQQQIERIEKEVPIYLAFKDASARIDSEVEPGQLKGGSETIMKYHHEGLKIYGLEKEAWGGTAFELFAGPGSWMNLSGRDTDHDILIGKITKAYLNDEYKDGVSARKSVDVLVNTFAHEDTNLPSIVSTSDSWQAIADRAISLGDPGVVSGVFLSEFITSSAGRAAVNRFGDVLQDVVAIDQFSTQRSQDIKLIEEKYDITLDLPNTYEYTAVPWLESDYGFSSSYGASFQQRVGIFASGRFSTPNDFNSFTILPQQEWASLTEAYEDDFSGIQQALVNDYFQVSPVSRLASIERMSKWKDEEVTLSNLDLSVDYTGVTYSPISYHTGSWDAPVYHKEKSSKGSMGVLEIAGSLAGTTVMFSFGIPIVLPIGIDLGGDGIELVDVYSSTALYDMNGDGIRDLTSWVGPSDAILAIDINGDGIISKTEEICFKMWSDAAKTDLEGLRYAFDSNKDSVLDKEDERFAELKVWQDINQNGVSELSELSSLEEVGIESINFDEKAEKLIFTSARSISATNAVKINWDSEIAGGSAYDLSFGFADGVEAFEQGFDELKIHKTNGESYKIYKPKNSEQLNMEINESGYRSVFGSSFNDYLSAEGSKFSVILDAREGNDTIFGTSKSDWLRGGHGVDIVKAGAGNDVLFLDEDDRFDQIDAGAGYDTAFIYANEKELSLDLGKMNLEAVNTINKKDIQKKHAVGIVYDAKSSKEGVYVVGSRRNDVFKGSKYDDVYISQGGKNEISAGDGNDLAIVKYSDIQGGPYDRGFNLSNIDMGKGRDTLIFSTPKEKVDIDITSTNVEIAYVSYGSTIRYSGASNVQLIGSNLYSSSGHDILMPMSPGRVEGGYGSDRYFIDSFGVTEIINKYAALNDKNSVFIHSDVAIDKLYASLSNGALKLSSYDSWNFGLKIYNWNHDSESELYSFFVNAEKDDAHTRAVVKASFCNNGKKVACDEEVNLSKKQPWVLYTADGNDRISTGMLPDVVHSGAGDDHVKTWSGDDVINGGKGFNILEGWCGHDTYMYFREGRPGHWGAGEGYNI